jgi:histidyl-tRNA synthetase
VTLVHQGAGALERALVLRRELLGRGVLADVDYEPRSFKAQFRAADRAGSRFALVLGEDEVARGTATLKDLVAGTQETLPAEEALRQVIDVSSAQEKEA